MANSAQTAVRTGDLDTSTPGSTAQDRIENAADEPLTPQSPVLAVPMASATKYVVPRTRAAGWQGWRRGPPGDLEELVVGHDRLAELARSDGATWTAAIDTPAWPAALE